MNKDYEISRSIKAKITFEKSDKSLLNPLEMEIIESDILDMIFMDLE